jgi:hypothetical protein
LDISVGFSSLHGYNFSSLRNDLEVSSLCGHPHCPSGACSRQSELAESRRSNRQVIFLQLLKENGMSTSGAAGAGAAAAAIAQAIKASGVIVRVTPRDFLQILEHQEKPLVVHATGGVFKTNYQYLSSYKGLAFFTKSETPVSLPRGTELVHAEKIWIPG